MPTAAKLFAAFAFAILAFFTAEIIKPHFGPGTAFGYFSFVSSLVGVVAGWRVMGPAAGRGNRAAIYTGIQTSVAMVVLGLLVFSTYEMFVEAFRPSYKGPMEAIVAIVEIAVEYLKTIIAWDVIIVLVVGGALAGLLSEWANRRWR